MVSPDLNEEQAFNEIRANNKGIIFFMIFELIVNTCKYSVSKIYSRYSPNPPPIFHIPFHKIIIF